MNKALILLLAIFILSGCQDRNADLFFKGCREVNENRYIYTFEKENGKKVEFVSEEDKFSEMLEVNGRYDVTYITMEEDVEDFTIVKIELDNE